MTDKQHELRPGRNADGKEAGVGLFKVFGSATVLSGFSILLLMLALTFFVNRESEKSRTWVSHTRQVLTEINSMLSLMQDMETGQRGYLLTSDKIYLEPFNAAIGRISSDIAELRNLTMDNSVQQDNILLLEPLVEEKMAELKLTIDLHQKQGSAAALAVVRTNVGKEIMDRTRAVLQSMKTEERQLLAERETRASELGYYTMAAYALAVLALIVIALLIAARIRDFIVYRNQTEAALRMAIDEAEAANLAKSSFLSSMSHELRTPLNAILGFGQMLDDPENPLNENQQKSVRRILEGGDHLLDLINEVLELAKIESGKMELSIEPVPADAIISSGMMMGQSLGQRFGITVEKRLTETASAVVLADLTRARQVLINLMSNAVKYNRPSGSVFLDCVAAENSHIRFSVTDTGPGISAEKFDDLFKPFDRLENQNSTIEGTGIGLTITRELIDNMGGRMGFESTVGTGSTFWFELPATDENAVATAPDITLSSAAPSLKTATASLASPKRIFYVEDNPANTDLMKLIIAKAPNLSLETAETAEDGISAITANPPDLILMDINLPGMDGIEATLILNKNEATKDIPVFGVSANAMSEDVKTAQVAGFQRYITKPFDVIEVLEAVASAFGDETKSENVAAEQIAPQPEDADITSILSAEAIATIQRARESLPDSYTGILKNMFEAIPGLRDEMQAALANEDNKSLESAAHRMKTNSATLGAVELSALAQTTENAAKEGTLDAVPGFISEIENEYLRVTPAIEKLLG